MELTEDQQKWIKAEEIYRVEVQRQLKASSPRSRRERIFTFLNTPLGLWVLSSLFLGGLTAAYTHVQSQVAERNQMRMRIDQLNNQLALRLDYSLSLLQKGRSRNISQAGSDDSRSAYVSAVNIFLDDQPETRLSPDFKERSTLSLVFELQGLDRSPPRSGIHSYDAMIGNIGDLMEARQSLTSSRYIHLNDNDRKELLTRVDAVMEKINLQ